MAGANIQLCYPLNSIKINFATEEDNSRYEIKTLNEIGVVATQQTFVLMKTSSRRLDQDEYVRLSLTSSEDVFKTSSRHLAKISSRHFQGESLD